mmetsp:Transcript_57662/g.130654  ORF Transcript_57662/g.130654 Transcript_57662/m.130654 type:complete len:235 (+) Transcript_57662:848-1552(+)
MIEVVIVRDEGNAALRLDDRVSRAFDRDREGALRSHVDKGGPDVVPGGAGRSHVRKGDEDIELTQEPRCTVKNRGVGGRRLNRFHGDVRLLFLIATFDLSVLGGGVAKFVGREYDAVLENRKDLHLRDLAAQDLLIRGRRQPHHIALLLVALEPNHALPLSFHRVPLLLDDLVDLLDGLFDPGALRGQLHEHLGVLGLDTDVWKRIEIQHVLHEALEIGQVQVALVQGFHEAFA